MFPNGKNPILKGATIREHILSFKSSPYEKENKKFGQVNVRTVVEYFH